MPIDEDGDAYRINQISNAMVADSPTFPQIYASLRDLTNAHCPIAYNAAFDSRMVRQDCERHGLPTLGVLWDCAMEQYARFAGEPGKFGRPKWHQLQKACTDLSLPDREWHGALVDARATYELIIALAELRG